MNGFPCFKALISLRESDFDEILLLVKISRIINSIERNLKMREWKGEGSFDWYEIQLNIVLSKVIYLIYFENLTKWINVLNNLNKFFIKRNEYIYTFKTIRRKISIVKISKIPMSLHPFNLFQIPFRIPIRKIFTVRYRLNFSFGIFVFSSFFFSLSF